MLQRKLLLTAKKCLFLVRKESEISKKSNGIMLYHSLAELIHHRQVKVVASAKNSREKILQLGDYIYIYIYVHLKHHILYVPILSRFSETVFILGRTSGSASVHARAT